MKQLRWCWLSIVLAVLAGCATVYQPPKVNEPAAMLVVKSNSSGIATWVNPQVDAIDDKDPGFKFFASEKMRLHPGVHVLTIMTLFNRGFLSGGPYQSVCDVEANFKAGETYTVQAATKGSQVLVWITNSKGKKVSPVSSNSYQSAPRTQKTVIVAH